MKNITFILLMITLCMLTGCKSNDKNQYLPEAKNDKTFTTVGTEKKTSKPEPILYSGDGYTISIPAQNYRYEKDYDDGNLEEKWEYIKKDDVEIKITTYKNLDDITARGKFLKDNNDYIFEDLTGYSVCAMEPDGDTLWFNLYESNKTVYIVSWEYPKNTNEDLQKELANIAQTFNLTE